MAFPSPSPPCNFVPMFFELPVENNKHTNFDWRGQGRGADSFVLWSYPIWVQCLNNFVADCRYFFKRGRLDCISLKSFVRLNFVIWCLKVSQHLQPICGDRLIIISCKETKLLFSGQYLNLRLRPVILSPVKRSKQLAILPLPVAFCCVP